jgi:hypothetical protein
MLEADADRQPPGSASFRRACEALPDLGVDGRLGPTAFAAALQAPCGTTKLALAELSLGEGIQQREREILG